MLGSRAVWHEGWKVVSTHPTISGWSNFNDDEWELYNTAVDRSELHNLAAKHPEKVRELVNLWFAEAGANGAFPLDDRSALEIMLTPRPVLSPPRDRYVYFPGTAEVPESQAVNVRNRSYTIGALVDIPASGAEGVLFAHGSPFGGHALYVKDNRLHYVYNWVGMVGAARRRDRGHPDRRRADPLGVVRQGRRGATGGRHRPAHALARRQEGRRGADQDPARQVHDRRRGPLHRPRRRRRRHRRLPGSAAVARSPAAPSGASPSMSAARSTSTSSARPRRCSCASSGMAVSTRSELGVPAVLDPPPAFHLLAKPTGAVCNLDCSYCFFLSKEMLYPGSRFRMAEDMLEAYVRQLIEAHARVPEVTIAWQGGEPTMMGVEFFRRSVELANRYLKPGQRAAYTIQTNATLVDEEWAAFFKEHDFLVGVSIDGPRELHDAYRVNKGGRGSFDQVMRGLEHLRAAGVEWNALTTVHARNADQRPRGVSLPARRVRGRVRPVHPDHRAGGRGGRRRDGAVDVVARPAALRAGGQPRDRPLGHGRAVRPLPDRRVRGVGAA